MSEESAATVPDKFANQPTQPGYPVLAGGGQTFRFRSKYEILVALRTHQGIREDAAKELGISLGNLSDRINNDPQLKQLYGSKQNPTVMPMAPVEAEVLDRGKGDIPLPAEIPEDERASVANSLKLISLASPEDTKKLLSGLRAFDFSEKSLDKIRALGDLATNTGRFIAVSLEKTHQNYVVQQFGLMELAADIRRRLLIEKGDEGYIADDEARSFLYKNYVEMVRESGRGVERMLQVAEVITRMLEAASPKGRNGKVKKGWKKVTAVEAHNGEAPRQ